MHLYTIHLDSLFEILCNFYFSGSMKMNTVCCSMILRARSHLKATGNAIQVIVKVLLHFMSVYTYIIYIFRSYRHKSRSRSRSPGHRRTARSPERSRDRQKRKRSRSRDVRRSKSPRRQERNHKRFQVLIFSSFCLPF